MNSSYVLDILSKKSQTSDPFGPVFVWGWLKRLISQIPDGIVSTEIKELLVKLKSFGVKDEVLVEILTLESSRANLLMQMANFFKAIIDLQEVVPGQALMVGEEIGKVFPLCALLAPPNDSGLTAFEKLVMEANKGAEWGRLFSDLVMSGSFIEEPSARDLDLERLADVSLVENWSEWEEFSVRYGSA